MAVDRDGATDTAVAVVAVDTGRTRAGASETAFGGRDVGVFGTGGMSFGLWTGPAVRTERKDETDGECFGVLSAAFSAAAVVRTERKDETDGEGFDVFSTAPPGSLDVDAIDPFATSGRIGPDNV